MGLHRFRSTWRSLTFNRQLDDSGVVDDPALLDAAYANSDYRLESLDLTGVQTVDYRELRQHMEGSEPNQSFEGVRILVGQGLILASSAADLDDKTWAMYEAFSPAACRMASLATDPRGVLPFDFKRASAGGAKALRLYAKPAAGRPIVVGRMREGLARPFVFQLVAPDPFVYDQSLTQQAVALGGGTVTNPGTMYTYPRIVITMSGAGSAAFTVANSTTGQQVGIDLSGFSAGNVVTADARASTIVLGASTDRISKLLAGFLTNLFLLPGANAIAFTNTTGITSIRFDYRGAYA